MLHLGLFKFFKKVKPNQGQSKFEMHGLGLEEGHVV